MSGSLRQVLKAGSRRYQDDAFVSHSNDANERLLITAECIDKTSEGRVARGCMGLACNLGQTRADSYQNSMAGQLGA